jgi:DNA-binding MarR family transcriptional regulator
MGWSFITSHGQVLLAVAADPRRTIRQIADEVGLTERATHRVISSLAEAGYIDRIRVGRRVHYRLNLHLLQKEQVERARLVREMVSLLAATAPSTTTDERAREGTTG